MPTRNQAIRYPVLNLDGRCYAVVPEPVLQRLCRKAGVSCAAAHAASETPALDAFDDDDSFTERLVERRKRAGLSQAELARQAGVRVETLNRLERGHVTPDFATVRKLVVAMKAADERREAAELAAAGLARR